MTTLFSQRNGDQTAHSQGFSLAQVQIQSVDSSGMATVTDRYQRYYPPISVYNMTGSGALPQAGDMWMIDRSNGGWTFKTRVSTNLTPVTTFNQVVDVLDQLGFLTNNLPVTPSGDNTPPGIIEPYTGITAPVGWLNADGSPYSRVLYPNLWNALSIQTTGNTHATTTVDSLPATAVAQMMPGMPCCGTNIAAGVTITAILSTTSVQISTAASGTTTGGSFIVAPHGVGDGSTTFNVPDTRGKTLVGAGNQQPTINYVQQVLNLGPVGSWGLNETSGTVAADASTTGNNGTYSGGYTQGQVGPLTSMPQRTSTLFNGSTGVVTVPYNSALDLQRLSAETWCRFTSAPGTFASAIVEKSVGNVADSGYALLAWNNGSMYWRLVDSGSTLHDLIWGGLNGLNTNTWYHIVATYDGNSQALYVNGVVVLTTTPGALTLKTGSGNTYIGSRPGANFFAGDIGDVSIYPFAMTPAQIQANFRVGNPFVLGQLGGEEGHTIVTNELASHVHIQNGHAHTSAAHAHTQAAHTHDLTAPGLSPGSYCASWSSSTEGTSSASISTRSTYAVPSSCHTTSSTPGINSTTPGNTGTTTATDTANGNDNTHNNLQPYLPVNYIVKT